MLLLLDFLRKGRTFWTDILGSIDSSSKGFAGILEKLQSSHTKSIQSPSEPMAELSKIQVESDYKGPHVELPLSLTTTKELLEYFKNKKVPNTQTNWV